MLNCFSILLKVCETEHLFQCTFLEEAHRYVQNDNDTYLIGYNIFERVAKEGRKYGMILNLISQRPVEISETVISQCSNFIIFKMNHPRDLEYIKQMLPNISVEIVEKQKVYNLVLV